MEQFDKVRAIVKPKKNDDLKPGVEKVIGMEFEFEAAWIIEKGETYEGQFAMIIENTDKLRKIVPNPEWFWFPECDLEILETIEPIYGFDIDPLKEQA